MYLLEKPFALIPDIDKQIINGELRKTLSPLPYCLQSSLLHPNLPHPLSF